MSCTISQFSALQGKLHNSSLKRRRASGCDGRASQPPSEAVVTATIAVGIRGQELHKKNGSKTAYQILWCCNLEGASNFLLSPMTAALVGQCQHGERAHRPRTSDHVFIIIVVHVEQHC
ncbi:hypothetical protein ATANTOWER_007170 [Ataeniobius toweri]|uniref:Uncharacterized protein n=1 Tax=Ataeniobius toweri TaxID=208326 RepID=A0ABU7B1I9_9TELE|nr:hypothetical protein [Ataeniobius toweri]